MDTTGYKTLTCGKREGRSSLIRQGKEVQREAFKVGWLTVKFPDMGVRIRVGALSNKQRSAGVAYDSDLEVFEDIY